jgi:hypothetical protein
MVAVHDGPRARPIAQHIDAALSERRSSAWSGEAGFNDGDLGEGWVADPV